ncbi:hypothetical protein EJB05_12142, partial [Eragrostis curvula]
MTFYYVSLEGISIGNTRLPIPRHAKRCISFDDHIHARALSGYPFVLCMRGEHLHCKLNKNTLRIATPVGFRESITLQYSVAISFLWLGTESYLAEINGVSCGFAWLLSMALPVSRSRTDQQGKPPAFQLSGRCDGLLRRSEGRAGARARGESGIATAKAKGEQRQRFVLDAVNEL